MSKETIGPKIKQIRKSKNLSQDQLADLLGYSGKSVISHIEKGDVDMTYEKMLLAIRTLSIDANDLFQVNRIDKELEDIKINRRKDRKVIVYIHGLKGNAKEIENFSYLNEDYVLVGLDYIDGNPWELKETIKNEFINITKGFKEVYVIANSIGALYTFDYLYKLNIKKAFFISPLLNMHQIIKNMMKDNNISEELLKEKQFITLNDGTMLSHEYYAHTRQMNKNWNIPTEILYGDKDELVDLKSVIAFLRKYPNSKLTISKESGHYFHTPNDLEIIKNWIKSSI